MKALVIGLGGAGNKAALELEKEKIEGVDVIYINTTSIDIPDGVDPKRAIVLSDDPKRGAGKERARGKDYILRGIQSGKINLENDVEDKDLVILVASLEGGSGSGAAPVLGMYCEQALGKNTHIFGFCGFEEDSRGLRNSIEFFQELDDEFMVHTIQNLSFLPETKGGNNHVRAEELANREFVNRVKMLLGKEIVASRQNIDEMDLYKVINTVGYSTEEKIRLTGDMTEIEDFNKLIRQAVKKSKSLKTVSGCARLAVVLNISEANEDAVDFSFEEIKKAYGEPYEIYVQRQYDGGEEYIAFLISGMKMPLEEVEAIYKRYTEKSEMVPKTKDDFSRKVNEMMGNPADSRFDLGSLDRQTVPKKSKSEFLSQFTAKAVPSDKK